MLIYLVSLLSTFCLADSTSASVSNDIPATAKIIFLGTVTNFAVNIDEAAIESAIAAPTTDVYLFGGNTDTDGIPLCLFNNNTLNGVKLKVTQATTNGVAYTLNATIGSTAYSIPVSIILKGNGGATSTTSFKNASDSQSTFVSVLGATSGKIGPTISGSATATADSSGVATAHLDHTDLDTTTESYNSNDNTNQGCGTAPVYVDIVAKGSDLGKVAAGTYTAAIAFESVTCTDITTATADACT